MNALARSVPAPATLTAIRGDSARRGHSIPYLCAAAAEIERQLTKIYEPTGEMVGYAAEAEYLERVGPVISGLNDEQCRLVDALAAQPIATTADATDIARLALMLSEIASTGCVFYSGADFLLLRLAAFVAGGDD
jgi:hypothetical protein